MALEAIPYNCAVQITYHAGIDEYGKDRKVTRSLTGIKMDETDENIYDVVKTIIGLQEPAVIGVFRLDRTEFRG